jgi:hypothetical protein
MLNLREDSIVKGREIIRLRTEMEAREEHALAQEQRARDVHNELRVLLEKYHNVEEKLRVCSVALFTNN